MTEPVPWPTVKRSLVAILSGIRPSVLGPSDIAAQLAVLPKDVVVCAVGDVSEKNLAGYVAAGIQTFGLGSSLYRPGMTASEVRERALASVGAHDRSLADGRG